jgi:hypothetical protein
VWKKSKALLLGEDKYMERVRKSLQIAFLDWGFFNCRLENYNDSNSNNNNNNNNKGSARLRWLTPVILPTHGPEIRRIVIWKPAQANS